MKFSASSTTRGAESSHHASTTFGLGLSPPSRVSAPASPRPPIPRAPRRARARVAVPVSTGVLPPGTRLGNFRLVEFIREGGTCQLFTAVHINGHQRRIIRVLRRDIARVHPGLVDRLIESGRSTR